MMYNQAPRVTNLVNSQTTPDVGPTTYFTPEGRVRKAHAVPFLCSQERFTKLYSKSLSDAYYDLPGFLNSKGGSTPRNKSPRFVSKESDSPSPGQYDPKIEAGCERNVPCDVRPKKIYVCRVPYSVKGSAPSMPLDSCGYSLTRNDSIIKIPPKERDSSLGPAYYHVPSPAFAEPNRGCKWSGRTEKRSFYTVEATPGPGAYDVKFPDCQRRVEEEEFREMARRLCFVPRYLEVQEMRYRKEDLPGPAHYNTSQREHCKMCSSVNPRPFICGTKRFSSTVSENPGPGQYNIFPRKYPLSKRDVAFSTESSRFAKKRISISPGPAYYDIKSPLIEKLLKKKNPYAFFEVPFNNTARRDTLSLGPDAALNPSPADYVTEGRGHCKIFATSMFKSKTARFKRICMRNDLGPGTYNITDAFACTTKQVSHQAYEVSFNSTAKRKGILCGQEEYPGPADYCTKVGLSSKGHFIPISTRFQEGRFGPGPGTYYIHPSYDNSLYNASKTFNLRIKESVLRKKLRRSPQETYGKWAACLRKKKLLKWFYC